MPATKRPPLHYHSTTGKMNYMEMLFEANNNIPWWYGLLASGFTWIILAGWIVFPATFNKLQKDNDLDDKAESELERKILGSVRNLPVLYFAAFGCSIGVVGCVWLWWRWRKNYIWVISKILLPSLMNSIAGLVSTLVNIYTAQDGQYSVTALLTIAVTGGFSVLTLVLFVILNLFLLERLKRRHKKERAKYEQEQEEQEKEMRELEMRMRGGARV